MAYINRVERILGTVCFQCCTKPVFPGIPSSITRKDNHPELGEKVNTSGACACTQGLSCRQHRHPKPGETVSVNGVCADCPVADLRGDGAPISRGEEDPFFHFQIPGADCEQHMDLNKSWLPCIGCQRASYTQKADVLVIDQHDRTFCKTNCPVQEIRNDIEE